MRSLNVSVIDSKFHRINRRRRKTQPSAWPLFFGQSAGSLVLVLVIVASAVAILATISVLTNTKDLVGATNVNATQAVQPQPSADVSQLPPHP